MLRSYRYRLLPTRAQEATLMRWLDLTRELYNAALQERREAWQKQGVCINAFNQMREIPGVREVWPEISAVPAVAIRGTILRLGHAFDCFFRRCKRGEKPGYPRFRSNKRWDSILFGDLGGKIPICGGGTRVKIPLLGKVKFRQHRPIEGVPKQMQLKLGSDGYWYVSFVCNDVPVKPLPGTGREVGVDLGITTFAATSDGEMFENPRALERARLHVDRAQRKVSRRKKGSNRRRRAVQILARRHLRIVRVRRQNAIDVARRLVGQYDTIYVEALNIRGLSMGVLAKQVSDAGWGIFLHWLRVKAEEAGRAVVEVDPRGTSQMCSECGLEAPKDLAVRVHDCPHCGYVADRDVNAAQNIERLGRSLRGGAAAVTAPLRSAKSESFGDRDRSTPFRSSDGV